MFNYRNNCISSKCEKSMKEGKLSTNLIGQAMQRTSKTIHGSTECQIRVRQGAAHQVAGVGTDITSFMVTVTFHTT